MIYVYRCLKGFNDLVVNRDGESSLALLLATQPTKELVVVPAMKSFPFVDRGTIFG